MVDEALSPRRINSDLVQGQRCLVPARTVLTGREIRLEPLDEAARLRGGEGFIERRWLVRAEIVLHL